MKYTNSNNVTINFTPWFDSGFKFTKLHMIEELGGSIASGTIDLEHTGTEKVAEFITDQFTGVITLEKETGVVYEIDIFITDRSFFRNLLTLNFICIKDNKFITELQSINYSDIDFAIDTLYPGEIIKRDVETDVSSDLVIYQNNETNYSLCTKLALSYKANCIFGFGFEGLIIKDIIGTDSGGNKEPYWTTSAKAQLLQMDPISINYNKMLYQEVLDSWTEGETDYSEFLPKNSKTLTYYSSNSIVGANYDVLMRNYLQNREINSSDMYTSLRAVDFDIPEYKLGDVINYDLNEIEGTLPDKVYLVKSNEVFISIDGSKVVDSRGLHFSWVSKLVGLKLNGETLPKEDPTIS